MRTGLALAALITTFCMAHPLAQTPVPAAPTDAVSGTVADARDGHLIPNATVRLTASGPGPRIPPITTDAEGHFVFAAVPAGKYALSAVARGYFSASYMEHDGFYSGIVTGAGLDTTGLALRLMRLSSIAGQVLDQAGEPGVNTQVALYRVDPAGDTLPYIRAGNTNTDAEGRYSFKRLLPGRYFLSVTSTPWYAVHPRRDLPQGYMPYRTAVDPAVDVVYPITFYPHATRPEDARAIDLEGGEEFLADLTLTPEPSLSLSVQLPVNQPAVPAQMPQVQLVRSIFGHDEYVQQSQTDFTGATLTMTGIAPGVYKVLQSVNNNPFPIHTSMVDLSAGSATLQSATVPALASVTLHFHAANGTPLPPHQQLSLRDEANSRDAVSMLDANDTATVAGIPPGDYRFNFFGNTQFRVKTLVVNGKPAPGKLLHVANADAITADVTVIVGNRAEGSSTVEGVAYRAGKPALATFVLLIPALAHYDEQDVRRDQTNLDGSYSFANVQPGNYILIAVDEGWKLHWQNPQALLQYLEHGIPVTVPAASTKTAYRVPDKVNAQQR